jgi:hypothetical protein
VSTQVPKSHKRALEPYVAEDETALRTSSGGDRTYLLTDKRLIKFWQGQEQESGRARREVKTIRLDEVSKTTVNVRGREPIDYEKLGLAGGAASIALALIYGWYRAGSGDGTLTLLLLLGAVGLLAVAIGVAANAYDRDPPYVRLRLALAGGREETFSFMKGEVDFCESVSEAVGRQ